MHLASEQGNLDVIKVLLEHNADTEAEDAKGRRTPLFLAAKAKHSEAVKLLLSFGASTLATSFGQSAQQVIEASMPYFDVSKVEIVRKPRRNSIKDFGYGLNKLLDKAQMNKIKKRSNAQNLLQFKMLLARMTPENLDTFSAGDMTLMQKGCNYGLNQFVEQLLDQGANPNQTTTETGSSPLLLAAYYGHSAVIQVLMEHKVNSTEGGAQTADFSATERTSGESILHYLLMIPDRAIKTRDEVKSYEDCLDLILDCQYCTESNHACRVCLEILQIVNTKDNRGNTPLHYATSLWPQAYVRKLLNLGANIGIQNIWEERPISKILPQV